MMGDLGSLAQSQLATHTPSQQNRSIIIVGAGFAGICAAVLLKQSGWRNITILERGDGVGGVWRENRYPGAACDVPTPLYSYSFENEYSWSAAYAAQPEILNYLQHCVRKYELEKYLHCGVRVMRAAFDSRISQWSVECSNGETRRCDVLLPAVGIFNTPVVPPLPGADSFAGPAFHSAQWRDDVSLVGRRVAVIGSGASAVQIVPALAKIAARVDVLQRTPAYVMPRKPVNMDMAADERRRLFREFDDVAERRKAPELVLDAQQAFVAHLTRSVADPELRKALTPTYLFGCKRTLFSDDWYLSLQKSNVRPIFSRIERITPSGIRLTDGMHADVDVIVYATGFDPSSYLPGLEVEANGRMLREDWRFGAQAHLGITVSGFPNLFLMYGPNTNVAGSVVHMHECQARYIMQCLRAMSERRAAAMEVRADVMRRSCDEVQERLAASVMAASHCHSYAMDQSGRVITQYPGSQSDYERETTLLDANDYVFSTATLPELARMPLVS